MIAWKFLKPRQRLGVALTGLGAFIIAIAGTVSLVSFQNIPISDGPIQAVKSFAALMNQRSPGERIGDMLAKTKQRDSRTTTKRKVAVPPAAPLHVITNVTPPPDLLAPPVLFDVPPEPELLVAPFELAEVLLPSVSGGGLGGSPGGGGGGAGPPLIPGSPPGVSEPPTPPPPVPEPSTWAMMLVGFGLVGFATRKQKARSGREALSV